MAKKILHIDSNHPILIQELNNIGYENHTKYEDSKESIAEIISQYHGIVIRSRFSIDRNFLEKATNLKFIARVGAGLENIDVQYATSRGITLVNAPEGNRAAVAEHAMGMLLNLMNKLKLVDQQVRQGKWIREDNRGFEIRNKTVGIIGYGHMGKAFAQRLQGFDCKVIYYDIEPKSKDSYAQQVTKEELLENADIISLHTPQTPETLHLIDEGFFNALKKPVWFINTARGKSVNTQDLVKAINNGKVLGAGLDVLEYEKSSFENMFNDKDLPEPLQYLLQSPKVLLSPHIAGWTIESKIDLAQVIINKIKANNL